jgi:putative membrane protein
MEIKLDVLIHAVLSSAVFSTMGLLFFAGTFFVIQKILPFSLRKELEEDHNTALGIVIAAVIIGIAMIVSAAVHG